MAVVGFATVQLIPSMEGFTSAVKEQLGGVNETISTSTSSASEKAGSDAGNRFGGGFLKTAGSFLTAQLGYELFSGLQQGIKDTLSAGFNDAAFLQSSAKSLTILTGSAATAKSEMAQLYAFAEKTPFSAQSAVKYAQQLLGAGAAAKSIVPDLTAMGDAVSAVGGSQSDMDDAMLGFTQMMTRGKLDLQDLRQISNSGIPVFQELAKALGKPASSIQDLISSGTLMSDTVLPKLLAQMEKDYGGSMAAQSKTLTGEWSNLTDTINQSLGVAFTPLANWLATKLPAVTTIAGHAISGVSGFFKSVTDDVKTLIGWLQKLPSMPGFGSSPFTTMLNSAESLLDPKTPAAKSPATPTRPSFIPMPSTPADIAAPVPIASKAPSWLKMPAPTAAPASFVKPPSSTPADLAKPAGGADPSKSITDTQKALTAVNPVVKAYAGMLDALYQAGKKLGAIYVSLAQDLTRTMAPAFSGVLPVLAQFYTTLGQLITVGTDITTRFWPAFKDVFDYIGPVVAGAFQTVVAAVKAALSLIEFIFVPLGDLLDGNFGKFRADIVKYGTQLGHDLGSLFGKALGTVTVAILGLIPALVKVAGDLFAGFSGRWNKDVNAWVAKCTEPFDKMMTAVKKFFGIASPSKVMQQIGEWVVQGFTNGIDIQMKAVLAWGEGLAGQVTGAIGDAKAWLVAKGSQALAGMLAGAESGWHSLSAFFGGLGGDILGALGSLGSILEGAGEGIMGGFLKGLETGYEKVKSLVGGVAQWIKDHKGPLSYDAVLLTPAGEAVMSGFRKGLGNQFTGLQSDIAKVNASLLGIGAARPTYVTPPTLTSGGLTQAVERTGNVTALRPAVQQTFVTNNPVAKDPMQSIRTAANTARAHMSLNFA